MAVRLLQRRLSSFLLRNNPPSTPLRKDPPIQLVASARAYFNQYDFHRRGIQSKTGPINPSGEDLGNRESGSLKASSDSANIPSQIEVASSSVKCSAVSNLKTSSRHDLAMIFTCKVCETRSVKTVCRESYEKGVVVARCGGCNNLHLIADHLGWFGEPGSVEDFLAARGEEVKKGNVDTLSLTLDDLTGKKL
ncbi:hypothetical protein UlMin_025938 [Ulmus minor]